MPTRTLTAALISIAAMAAAFGAFGWCGDAFGHSGEVAAPPPPPPPPAPVGRPGRAPGGPPSGGGGRVGGPRSGPGKAGGGPRTGGGSRGPQGFDPNRASAPATGGPDPDHWSFWWFVNRRRFLDVTELEATVTPSAAPRRTAADPADSLWRAEAQRALVVALSDDDEEVAASAAVALGKLGDPSLTPVLTAVLRDGDRPQTVREAAAVGLGLLGTGGGPDDAARDALMTVGADDGEATRLRATAIHALGMRREPESLPYLLEVAFEAAPEWDIPTTATVALGLLGDDIVRAELEQLLAGGKRAQRFRRVYAAQALAHAGDKGAVPALMKSATADDPHVRKAVFLALGVLAADDEDAIDLLVRAVYRERNSGAQNAAVIALGGTGHRKADAALRHAYEKGDNLHQHFAALALGLLARKRGDPSIVAALETDLKERANADLRGALAISLGLARRKAAAPLLIEIAKDRGDPGLRAKAALAVGMTGALEYSAELAEIVSAERDATLRAEAALGLGLLGDRSAVPFLSTLIDDGSSVYVQGSSAVALGRLGGADAGRALTAMLSNQRHADVSRSAAAISLGFLLGPDGGRRIAIVGQHLDWTSLTPTVYELIQVQ